MTNWLLYTDRDKDVQDSYAAALTAYAGLNKRYAEEYQDSHRSQEDKHVEEDDPILNEFQRSAVAASEADKAASSEASERSKTEFDALTRLLHSVDSIPVCSTR
jgi:hypothetical protein